MDSSRQSRTAVSTSRLRRLSPCGAKGLSASNVSRLAEGWIADFEAWTKSDAFRKAHARADNQTTKPLTMGHPNFEGFYVVQEVTADGYDEALLLDTEGYVSEGAGENVFIVKAGKIYTPDLASCLDGITRDSVLTMARDLGIDVIEKRITRDEIYCADEAFFTGTAAEVTPIRELDGRQIGAGSRGSAGSQHR